MAEALFRGLVQGRSDYEVLSAGVGAMPGQAASRHSVELLRTLGYDLTRHRSRPITRELLQRSTHIFAMSGHHLSALEMDFPTASDKAYLVSEFAQDDSLRGRDVIDPFGSSRAAYQETLEHLEKLLPSVLAYIEQTWKADKEAGRGTEQDD